MEDKHDEYSLETDDIKFIWGVKSFDNLSGSDANLYTMNDIDIVYDKKNSEYMLGVETAYLFDSIKSSGLKVLRNSSGKHKIVVPK